MNFLGEMYAGGKGAPRDYSKAADWFRRAGEKGDPDAQNNLGELYANGWGVAIDRPRSAELFRSASENGSALGSYNLGRIFLLGAGVTKSPDQAARAFEKAVKAAPADARFHNWLGSAYLDAGRFREADDQFRAVVASGGAFEDAWNYEWGEALLQLERPDEAAAAFRRALAEDPSHNRGVNRGTLAAAELARIDDYRAHFDAATAALASRDRSGARAELEAARKSLDTAAARERLEALDTGAVSGAWARLWPALGAVLIGGVGLGALLARRRRRAARFSALAPPPGRLRGRYELQKLIGEGGMGLVYQAYDHQLGRKAAAKKMRPELRQWTVDRERFRKEAAAVARLKHPNIVGIIDVIGDDDDTVLILDFIEGRPLSEVLAEKGRLSFEEARAILRQVCSAIEYAHSEGVVHRDLKPSNVMVAPGGRVVVMDFGLAREIKDTLSHLTATQPIGTLVYMAPEQHLGQVCRQSDVYALGVTLYEMLTGRRPFEGPDYLVQKQRLRYRKAGELAPGAPAGVDDFIAAALEPEPGQRLKSALDFAQSLDAFAADIRP